MQSVGGADGVHTARHREPAVENMVSAGNTHRRGSFAFDRNTPREAETSALVGCVVVGLDEGLWRRPHDDDCRDELPTGLATNLVTIPRSGYFFVFLERVMGLEPTTSTLARLHSTTELHPQSGRGF